MLTPFEWEYVYLFDPYTPNKQIFKTIGLYWNGVQQQTSSGSMQILFVNKKKVVCYCSGRGAENGYFISADFLKGNKKLRKSDNPTFKYNATKTQSLGYVYLEYDENNEAN